MGLVAGVAGADDARTRFQQTKGFAECVEEQMGIESIGARVAEERAVGGGDDRRTAKKNALSLKGLEGERVWGNDTSG